MKWQGILTYGYDADDDDDDERIRKVETWI